MVDKKNCEKCGSQIKITILLYILVVATKTCKAAICSRCKNRNSNRNSFSTKGFLQKIHTEKKSKIDT